MQISEAEHTKAKQLIAMMQQERLPWWRLWRELADYYLPRRYVWLLSPQEARRIESKNPYILDATGTTAARTLASGMMNGITSPSRPWFKLRINGFDDDAETPARIWMDEVQRRMLLVMAESNFYNAMAVLYLDLVVFGSASMLIYEDYESVIRCYNSALGEFYLGQSDRLQVNLFAREFHYKVRQVVERWGIENVSPSVKSAYQQGGAAMLQDVKITHLIEPAEGRRPYQETYWETNGPLGTVLGKSTFREMPGVFPRWELTANDSYGSCPSMDALGDVIQLQHETKKKAQGLDKMLSPPIIADVQLQHKPTSLLPGGITYVQGVNNVGAKPIYTVNPPLGEMTADIRDIQGRIRETFHNDLFRMISQLDTVRSATEIDARKEEKLVLLGSVLERFENEALDPAINRIFSIMDKAGLLPEVPPEIADANLEIQYVSILTTAQRAVGVAPVERWLQVIGSVAPIYPGAVNIPEWDSLIRNYGRDIGVAARDIKSQEAVDEQKAAQDQLVQQREAAATGKVLVDSAKQLGQTEVGGGANALQMLLGQ